MDPLVIIIAIFVLMFMASWFGVIRLNLFVPDITTPVIWTFLLLFTVLLIQIVSPASYDEMAPHVRSNLEIPSDFILILTISGLSLLMLICGIFLSTMLIGSNSNKCYNWHKRPINITHVTKASDVTFLWSFIMSCLLSIWYIQFIGGLGKLPLYMMVTGASYDEIIFAREHSFKLIPFPFSHIFHSLRVFFYPWLSCYAYVSMRLHPGNYKKVLVCTFTVALSMAFNAGSSALGPALSIIVMLMLCELLLGKATPASIAAKVVPLFVALLLMFYVMVSLTDGKFSNFFVFTQKVLSEEILEKGFSCAQDAAVFTNIYGNEPVGVSAIPKLAALFGVEARNINNEMFLAIAPDHNIQTGTYNGAWYLYDYVIFGFTGLLVGSTVTGIFLGYTNNYVMLLPKDPLSISVFGYSILTARGLFDKPFWTWLFSQGGALGICWLLFVYWASRYFPTNSNRSRINASRSSKFLVKT